MFKVFRTVRADLWTKRGFEGVCDLIIDENKFVNALVLFGMQSVLARAFTRT